MSRVILTTAYTKEMAANAVGTQQAWGFIRKPYHIADLISLLRRTETSDGGNGDPGDGTGVDRQIAARDFFASARSAAESTHVVTSCSVLSVV